MKTRTVNLGSEEEKTLEVVFGAGQRIFGCVKGLPPAPMRSKPCRSAATFSGLLLDLGQSLRSSLQDILFLRSAGKKRLQE